MPETKKIQYGNQTIDLPAGMTLEEAKAQMARFFPELAEPRIETKKDGDTTTYVFSKQAGRKGAQTLAARLLKLECWPVADSAVLAALQGDCEDPQALIRQLAAEAEAVARAREQLCDVPPDVGAQPAAPILL